MTHRHRVVQKAEIISAYYARRPFQRDISMLIVLHHLWVRPCSLPRRRSVGLTLSRDDDDDESADCGHLGFQTFEPVELKTCDKF